MMAGDLSEMNRRVTLYGSDTAPPLLCPDLQPVLVAHENPWFKVRSRNSYYTVEYDDPQVVTLPILDGHSIIMIRVKRPVIDDTPLELPAGGSYNGESPRKAAMREFREETGIVIDDPERFAAELPLGEMPGRMPVLLSVFRVNVTATEYDARGAHDDEVVSVEVISFADAIRKLIEGDIYLTSPAAIVSRFLFQSGQVSPPGQDQTLAAGIRRY
jgi:8-oxo-dGTP pyrophosphatase MutT (NUDIX family)